MTKTLRICEVIRIRNKLDMMLDAVPFYSKQLSNGTVNGFILSDSLMSRQKTYCVLIKYIKQYNIFSIVCYKPTLKYSMKLNHNLLPVICCIKLRISSSKEVLINRWHLWNNAQCRDIAIVKFLRTLLKIK